MQLRRLTRQEILDIRSSIRVIVDCVTNWGHAPTEHSLYGATLGVEYFISLTVDPDPTALDSHLRRARQYEWPLSIPETLQGSDECLTPDGVFLNDELVYSYHLYVLESCD